MAERKRFEALPLSEIHQGCSRRLQDLVFANCGACSLRVGLHCSDCNIQVTGCLCTEYERFGNDEAWKRAVERYGEELAKEKARSAGLWVPE